MAARASRLERLREGSNVTTCLHNLFQIRYKIPFSLILIYNNSGALATAQWVRVSSADRWPVSRWSISAHGSWSALLPRACLRGLIG